MTNKDVDIVRQWIFNHTPPNGLVTCYYYSNPITKAHIFNSTIKWFRSYVERECLEEFNIGFESNANLISPWVLYIKDMQISERYYYFEDIIL